MYYNKTKKTDQQLKTDRKTNTYQNFLDVVPELFEFIEILLTFFSVLLQFLTNNIQT